MSNTPIYDQKGKIIGWKTGEARSNSTYFNEKGQVIARVRDGSTYGSDNKVKGKGDQALKLFGN